MMKNTFKKTTAVLIASVITLFGILFIGSCTVGLGDAVDVDAPTVDISYPPKNAVVRESFIAAGSCDDDLALSAVQVTVTNTSTKEVYGPYNATLSQDLKSWTVELNKKAEGDFDAFNAYAQWEYPDGNYIISAVSYDTTFKVSQEASLPVSIDNTAPVLLVSKPLAVGTETASIYGRNFNIIGDISEEHDTKKLTLFYKEFDETTNSFIDSSVRSLEITGFGTMSSDNPLSIAKYDEDTADNASSLLTQNYRSIYGQNIDVSQSNKKNYYCGFLLEDSAKIYRDPEDSGEEKGNQTSQYYILSDAYNENLFSEATYSLNARNLMLLLKGQSSYSQQAIDDITNKLRETGNSASSTNLNPENSSKFSIDPKNNPVWAISNFDYSSETFKGYDLGSAIPLVLKVGGDSVAINKSSIEVKLYHLGNGDTPGVIEADTPYVTLINRGEYQDGLLKDRVNQADSALAFTSTDVGIKINHFYEFVITGEDEAGISIESENGLRYGFKRNSTYISPRITFVSDSESFAENVFKSAAALDANTAQGGITIKGKIITGHKDVAIEDASKISISGITITDTSDSSISISASNTAPAEVQYQYAITSLENTFPGDDENGKSYDFTARITKKDSSSSLAPSPALGHESSYKYKIGFVAEDNLGAKNDAVEFEFKVDNKAPEIPLSGITVTPTVTKDGVAKVNGTIRITGTVSDVGSGFSKLYWGIGNATPVELTNASSPWTISSIDTTSLTDNQTHILTLITEDNVGNRRTQTYDLNVDQETDFPVIEYINDTTILSKTNNRLIGTVTDDDGLDSVIVQYKKVSPGDEESNYTTYSTETLNGTTAHPLSITLPDTEGEYKVKVTAVDIFNLSTEEKNGPRFTPIEPVTIKKDNGAPDFRLSNSNANSNAQTYYKNSVTVQGTIQDGSGAAYIDREIFKIINGTENRIEDSVSLVKTSVEGTDADEVLVLGSSSPDAAPASVGTETQIVAGRAWKNTVNFAESGTYKIRYTSKDKYANYDGHTETQDVLFTIDNDIPVIQSIKLGDNEITGWYNTDSGTFKIVTSDGLTGSGVTSVAYTKSNPATTANPVWVNMSASDSSGNNWESFIAFDDDATEKHLYFKATDKVGNVSAIKPVTLQIDVNPPELTVSASSGNKYVNKQNDIQISGTFFDGNNESGTESLTFKIGSATLPASAVTLTQNGNNYTAVILKDYLNTGALTVTGKDIAGNTKEVTPFTFIVDENPPEINEVNLLMSNSTSVYKKPAGTVDSRDTYYICRTSGNSNTATLTISGTSTDDNAFDKIEFSISDHSDYDDNTEASSWSFSSLSFSSWGATDTAIVTLTASDKAGNSTSKCFNIKFDEAAPELKKDEETISGYSFRGQTVTKWNSLLIGTGRYSAHSYGRLTSVDFTTYFEESGSGLSKLEYKLFAADRTGTAPAFDATTGWTSSGTFNIAATNPDNSYDVKATASISGFKPTTGSQTNYLYLRPTDNCGNTGAITVLSVHVDQTAPTVVASSIKKLTNGTSNIILNGAVYDVDSGLKALRVKINGETVIETTGENTVTNDYGTFTYTGYAPENPAATNPTLNDSETYTLGNAPSYATWTLTLTPGNPETNTQKAWFAAAAALSELPVVAIEAEDWAEHEGTGNIAPNPTKIATLDIDTAAPEVNELSPVEGSKINGNNKITGSLIDAVGLPESVSLYYAPVTSATPPESLADYTLLKTLTTAAGTSNAIITYNQSISQIYNFSFTQNFYGTIDGTINGPTFISETEPTKDIWILIRAKDEAGNESVNTPVKYTIDRNQDRPVITLTDIDLTGVTTDAPKLLSENNTVYISISDDDGTVNSASFRTIRGGTTSAWTNIPLTSGTGHFQLTNEGEQQIEFKVEDSTTKVFETNATQSWNKVKILKSASASVPQYLETSIPVVLDTLAPEVTLTEINAGSEWVAASSFTTILGGRTENVQFKFTATDSGMGVDENKVKAIVKLDDTPIEGSPATKLSDDTYTVTIPCSSGSGVLTVKFTAEDKAGHEGSTPDKQFTLDNTKPVISVIAPSSEQEQSGTINASGTISKSVKLSYAISPIAASPDGYTSSTAFSYLKKDSDTGVASTVALTSSSLENLCSYKAYSDPADTRISSFSIAFDVSSTNASTAPNHTSVLNKWLTDMGITTEEALIDTTNPFDDIVKLYLHLKAEDPAGNVKEVAYPIWVDPQGDRPKIHFIYPSTDNTTLGGSINIKGSVEGKTSSYDVYIQVDADGDGDWDNDDRTMLESAAYGYTLYSIPNLSGAYGIKIHIEGTTWNQKINERGEFDPAVEGQKRTIKLRFYAVDAENRISSVQIKTINIDNDIPVVNQNVQLVQWKNGFSAANGFNLTADGFAQLESDGSVKFANGAVKAKRSYSEGMSVPGKWYVIGSVSDFSGISEVRTGGSAGTLLTGTLNTNEAVIIPYKVAYGEDIVTNYVFSFPVGSTASEAVGTSEVTIYAKDNGTEEKAKTVTKVFKVNYDNKAPVVPPVVDIENGLRILNSNGYYSFGSEAYEESVNGANQSGIDRIAFYFTRELNGQTKALNPVIRPKKNGNEIPGNQMNASDFAEGPEGLLWQSVDVSEVNDAEITVNSVPVYAHKGGLVKVNETIYKITNISGTHITLSGAPGNSETALFTFAGVVDNEIPEDIPSDADKITADYGYGYPVSSHDDGDLIPESCLKSGAKCTWEASINSKNMSDGPVTLHYVVFDKAGNYSTHSATGIVQNNSPRLAGALVGTDENGNGIVDESEFVSYHQLYTSGYNGLNKITELTLPVGATAAEPASAITIKRKTVIKPEIIGGNGVVGYTYTVSKRNGTTWGSEYFYSGNIPEDLGTGTEDSDDTVTLSSEGIVLTVDDILRNGICDEQYQKFAFTIWDHTPGLTYGQNSQNAVLNVIMDVALNDTTPATNKIIPFYWNSAKDNSLKDDSSNYGHIELSKDLPSTITSRNPKVSGAFKLEGIAQDNSLLKELWVNLKGDKKIASYADGSWTTYSGTGWSAEIRQATYAEIKAAGYITTNPVGKRDKDNVPYASQAYGHIVHWTMNIDTEVMGITPEEDIDITVSALDKGTPYTAAGTANRDAGGALIYTSKAFANNGDGIAPEQSGGNDGEQTYTSRYTLDVVPYITTIKTKLSENSKKTDSTEFDRTALGHYPVAVGETIRISGFNLANGTVKFASSDGLPAEVTYNANGFVLPSNAKSGEVSIVVAGVESYNNKNNNNSQGSYGASMPAVSTYGDKRTYTTFTNFYNRRPNTANNYILTDDVEFDVWQINSTAAKPYAAGVVSDPIMKVNPNNGIIGFAYQSGDRRFSMAKGNDNSYQGYIGDYDNQSATGFAYDSAGNTYGVSLGGDINGTNSVAKFAFMASMWGSSGMGDSANKTGGSHMRFEQIGQIGTKADRTPDGGSTTDSPGQYIDKSRALSPSIAVSGSGTSANVYLAYYDNFNQEIRFRWASMPKSGAKGFNGKSYIDDNYGSKELGTNSKLQDGNGKYWSLDKYNIIDFQIIAEEKSYTYAETANGSSVKDDNYKSVGVERTSPSLGSSGPYVDIAVLPANSEGNSNNYDVVVLVWYDSKNNRLMYTYNKVNLASVTRADFEGSAHTKDHWHTAKTIFSHAGYYCNIEADGKGGIHIAGYDNDAGDIYYAKLPSFSATYSESTMSCIVDSNGMVGSNLTLDVAYDKAASEGGKAIPYISYYGSIGPKMAYLTAEGAAQTSVTAGAIKDKFTGFWEITEIPTTSNAPKDRVNVGIWKDANGVVKASTSVKAALTPAGSNTTAANAVTIGNGTTNPVIGYEIRPTSSEGYMETAQKK